MSGKASLAIIAAGLMMLVAPPARAQTPPDPAHEEAIAYYLGSAALNDRCKLFPGESRHLYERARALAAKWHLSEDDTRRIGDEIRQTVLLGGCSGVSEQVREAIARARKPLPKTD
jgi:hypothetical protein